jgi:hypothetical protein
LLGGAAGLAVAAAGTLVAASPAEAAPGGDLILGKSNSAGAHETDLVSSNHKDPFPTLAASTACIVNTDNAIALYAYDNGGREFDGRVGKNAIVAEVRGKGDGTGNTSAAIMAENTGGGAAIQAQVKYGSPAIIALSSGPEAAVFASDSSTYGTGTGPGVLVELTNENPSAAVQANTTGTGAGVVTQLSNKKGTGDAVQAINYGLGYGVSVSLLNPDNLLAAIFASTAGAGPAIEASTTGSGNALEVDGPVQFSTSGLVTVAAGEESVTVTVAGLTESSMILATLQSDATSGGVPIAVASAVLGASVGGGAPPSFTITLSANAPASPAVTNVAWFVLQGPSSATSP